MSDGKPIKDCSRIVKNEQILLKTIGLLNSISIPILPFEVATVTVRFCECEILKSICSISLAYGLPNCF